MPYFVYILRLRSNHLYVGSTDDIIRRLAEHRCGCGGKTTAESPPIELLYSESFPDRRWAIQRERQLKCWSRAKKLALVRGDLAELKRLARCQSNSEGKL